MSDDVKKRTTVFFIARSHGDLSWYLAVNTLRMAANDDSANADSLSAPRVSAIDAPRQPLRLVKTRADLS